MLKNIKPMIQEGNVADLSKPSRAHGMYAALENAMQMLEEPYDYDFLMGVSGHAFRLMIHENGVYIEPPDDGQNHYFRYCARRRSSPGLWRIRPSVFRRLGTG